jgi:hypothetical protein
MPDDGRINERIIANLRKKDWLQKLESAYLVYLTDFHSPEIKRLYLRFFDIRSLNVHFIRSIAAPGFRMRWWYRRKVSGERHLQSDCRLGR